MTSKLPSRICKGFSTALARATTVLLLALTLAPTANAAGYSTQGGKIYDAAGQEVQVRGVSHFGFNADILVPQYLWEMGWKEQISQIKSLGFNAVRVPFVPDTLYVTTKVEQLGYIDPNLNPELIGKTPLQVLDLWMAEANRQGLYIMLDFHSLSKVNQYQTWFNDDPSAYGTGKWAATWNGQAYTTENWKRDLAFVAARYANLPYFFAIDIFNEPQGIVRWSTGDPNSSNPKYFWKAAAEGASASVLQANPKLLVFVQGINANHDGIENSNIPINWGENFQPQAYQPLNIPNNKLVLSPHTYGPDVFVKPTFSAANYPANLAADWEKLFGRFSSQHPVVIGEWGGRLGQGGTGQADVDWQNALVDYLLSKGIRNSFYWCYTPNSGDSGGVLDDNLNVRQDKMALLRRHWGSAAPTTSSMLALSTGSAAVAQSAGIVTVTVNRSGNTSAAASVKYATANGSATSGTHYTAKSGTLNWAANDTAGKKIEVAISNATPFGGDKSFAIALSSPGSGASLGTPSTATVTIKGSAVATNAGALKISASSYTVAQSAGSLMVSLIRTGGSSGAVSVSYATVDGAAMAGRDYTSKSGTINWGGGDTSTRTFTVAIPTATPFSGARAFSIKLSNATGGATLASPATATVTINGSGGSTVASLAMAAASYTVTQSAGSVKVTVKRNGSTAAAVSVAYVTANGSARAGYEYSRTAGTLRWAKGASQAQSITIPIRKTTPFTGTRSFTVKLWSTTGGATLGSPSAATITISGSKTASIPSYTQPYIQSFSPASGAVGTVVTLTGSGFTGVNAAWAGAAHNAGVTVVSDTQLKVTIPAGATTGAIGIFNPGYTSFTATPFTVTTGTASYTQPYIDNFSPASGKLGTVVTVNGRGFTGLNSAWVGNAHDASINVISDTQVKVTVPAGATTGAIGIFNPGFVSFTASSFTVMP
ncbi:MAG: cellulase family glycosylhydrolase [Pseudomonadota bacterium]|nr:cellulase family glycosylhydrolase [Pseudomonadota bacterium]